MCKTATEHPRAPFSNASLTILRLPQSSRSTSTSLRLRSSHEHPIRLRTVHPTATVSRPPQPYPSRLNLLPSTPTISRSQTSHNPDNPSTTPIFPVLINFPRAAIISQTPHSSPHRSSYRNSISTTSTILPASTFSFAPQPSPDPKHPDQSNHLPKPRKLEPSSSHTLTGNLQSTSPLLSHDVTLAPMQAITRSLPIAEPFSAMRMWGTELSWITLSRRYVIVFGGLPHKEPRPICKAPTPTSRFPDDSRAAGTGCASRTACAVPRTACVGAAQAQLLTRP